MDDHHAESASTYGAYTSMPEIYAARGSINSPEPASCSLNHIMQIPRRATGLQLMREQYHDSASPAQSTASIHSSTTLTATERSVNIEWPSILRETRQSIFRDYGRAAIAGDYNVQQQVPHESTLQIRGAIPMHAELEEAHVVKQVDAERLNGINWSTVEEESCSYIPGTRSERLAAAQAYTVLHCTESGAEPELEQSREITYEYHHSPDNDLVSAGSVLKKTKAKRCTRHSPATIAELEAVFRECPTPNELDRMELSRRLGITVQQVKYWFQNRRTQFKSENSKLQNSLMKEENERLRAENLALRSALQNAKSCPNCNGAISIRKSLERQQIRFDNAFLKDQLERYRSLSKKHSENKRPLPSIPFAIPSLTANVSTMGGDPWKPCRKHGIFQRSEGYCRDGPKNVEVVTADSDNPQPLTDTEKTMIAELALVAAEEFMQMSFCNEPLWVISSNTSDPREALDFDEYLHQFPRGIGPMPDGYRSEASRGTNTVTADAHFIRDCFLDVKCWMDLFPCIITKAEAGQMISAGSPIDRDGALQLMFAELQVPSPVVPTRQVYFLRYCKMMGEKTWAVVDVSVDNLRGDSPSTAHGCRKRPSGCLIQQLSDKLSKVLWVEHFEFDDSIHHHPFRPLVMSGMAFGAQRWLSSLKRQCARHAILTASNLSSSLERGLHESEVARKIALLKMGQSMTMQLCSSLSASLRWTSLTASRNTNEGRVMIRESCCLSPFDTSCVVLIAATSIQLSTLPHLVLEFLSNPDMRKEWDVLSLNGPVEELACVFTGHDPGNCVSLLRPTHGDNKMLILQECCSEDFCSTFAYAPVDINTINEAVTGIAANSFTYKGKPTLPSGFIIVPDGTSKDEAGSMTDKGGSLLTVVFQLLVSSKQSSKLPLEFIQMMNTLICNTVQRIKERLKGNDSDDHVDQTQSSKSPGSN